MKLIFDMDGPIYRFLSKLVDLVILNGMFLLFCIPIITIGASTTALYTVTLKMVRNEESGICNEFVQAFKKNFKQSTMIWILLMISGLILLLDILYLQLYKGTFTSIIILSILFFTVLLGLIMLLIFPYIARFENTVKESLINVIKIAIANPFQTTPVLIFSICPILLMFVSPYIFIPALYLSIFLGFSFVAFLNSFFFRSIYEKY